MSKGTIPPTKALREQLKNVVKANKANKKASK